MTAPITEQVSPDLREEGERKMEWARQHMPILAQLRE